MVMTDPIADLLTRIRNANMVVTKNWKFLLLILKKKLLKF